MAFPQAQDRLTQQFTTASDPWSVDMPASVSSGDLLMVWLAASGASAGDGGKFGTPSGWTEIHSDDNGDLVSSQAFIKTADGSEGGTSVDFSSGSTETGVAAVYRISQWDGTVGNVEIAETTDIAGSSGDCPSLTYSGGSADILWLACTLAGDDDATISSHPANYTDLTTEVSGAGTNSGATVGVSEREVTTATEDPGSYDYSENERKAVLTIAIPPGTSGGGDGGSILPSGTLASMGVGV